jgi:hypothetical protein
MRRTITHIYLHNIQSVFQLVSLATEPSDEAADNTNVHCLHSRRIHFFLEAEWWTPDLHFKPLKPEVYVNKDCPTYGTRAGCGSPFGVMWPARVLFAKYN